MFISVLKWHLINKHIVNITEKIALLPNLPQFFSSFLEQFPSCTGYLCSSSSPCPKQPPVYNTCNQEGRQNVPPQYSHIILVWFIWNYPCLTLLQVCWLWLNRDLHNFLMGILKADNTLLWECYFPVLFPQQNKSRYAPAYCCTWCFFLFTFDSGKKSHHKRCAYYCCLAMVKKKKEHPDPHLLFISLSKMKEILSYLTRTSHCRQCQEKEMECICGRRQWHSYDRLQTVQDSWH